jgi:signal transduction histidine kinase
MKNMTFKIQAEKINRLPEAIETCLYRITQEAIHNATKYAKSDFINIQIFENEQVVKLVISDNGEGFALKSVKSKMGGSGLKNMQARAELLNGTFKIQSKIGKGTIIKIEIPK